MELLNGLNLNASAEQLRYSGSNFTGKFSDSSIPQSDYAFVTGTLTGIVLTLFMRFYLSTSILSQKNHHLKFLVSQRSRYVFSLICLIISLALLPVFAGVVAVFGCYRYVVGLILRRKYGKQFGGLLSGRDVIWAVEDQSKNIINALMIVEEKPNLTTSFTETIKHNLYKEFTVGSLKGSKLSSTFHKELGYLFVLKNNIQPSEMVAEFDSEDPSRETITEEELRKTVCQQANLPMPKNHSAFLQVLIGKKPIEWKKRNSLSRKCYPIIFRIHHSFADGVCCLQIVTQCLADKNFNVVQKETIAYNNNNGSCENTMDKTQTNKKLKNTNGTLENEQRHLKENGEKIKSKNLNNNNNNINAMQLLRVIRKTLQFLANQSKALFTNLIVFVFGPTSLALQLYMRPSDENCLHGPELRGEKLFFWKTEDDEELVNLVRNLRKRIPGAAFLDIIFTAISGSFHEYLEKRSTKLPKYMTAVIPARLDLKGLREPPSEKFEITNNFTVGLFNLPIEVPHPVEISNGKVSLIPRLRETMKQTFMMKHSIDFFVNFWVMTIFNAVVPIPLLYPLFRLPHCSIIISNVPGPDNLALLDGNSLKDMVFWLPNRGFVGVGVSCLSYANRLQLGLIVDKALVSSDDNFQEILDNIPKYLRILDKETALGVTV